MLITNQALLEVLKTKRAYIAFDISGSVPDEFRAQFVPTMLKLVENCTHDSKPVMLTFDVDVEVLDFYTVGKYKDFRIGGTDVENLFSYIRDLQNQPEVLVIVSDGYFCWPKTDTIPNVEKYVVLVGNYTLTDNIPSYVKVA